jgi:hypothetical protein
MLGDTNQKDLEQSFLVCEPEVYPYEDSSLLLVAQP